MQNVSATAGVQADEEQHKLNAGARRVVVVGAERHQRVQGTHVSASEVMRMSTTARTCGLDLTICLSCIYSKAMLKKARRIHDQMWLLGIAAISAEGKGGHLQTTEQLRE
jgi:hypothetical protein